MPLQDLPPLSGGSGKKKSLRTGTWVLCGLPCILALIAAPAAAAVRIASVRLPEATVGYTYSQTLQATAGRPPYTWSVQSGKLPAGLMLSRTGTIWGWPKSAGNSKITVHVTDANGESASEEVTIVVNAPAISSFTLQPVASETVGETTGGERGSASRLQRRETIAPDAKSPWAFRHRSPRNRISVITTSTLPTGMVGVSYSATLQRSGGTAPYNWSIASGELPPGLGLAPVTGIVSGTPSASATYNFTVQMTDSKGLTATAALSIVVAVCTSCSSGLSVDTAALPAGTVNTAYLATLAASGGAAPYTWSLSSGQLPAGLTLATSGTISGMPTVTGSHSVALTVTDSGGHSASRTLPLTIAGPPLDQYGGRTDLSCTNGAQSRFYTQLIGSQWYLCTPAGHAMWGVGVYSAGPQGNYTAKYGSYATANLETAGRLKAWGFNFLDTYSVDSIQPWNLSSNQLASIYIVRPGTYGINASTQSSQVGPLDQSIKDLANGISPYFSNVYRNGMPDWGDTTRLGEALNYQLTQTQSIAPSGIAYAIQNKLSGLAYLIGIAVEDSDQTAAYFTTVENDPFDTQPSGQGAFYGGYFTAVMSPQQEADATHESLYSTDQTVYTKKAWQTYLEGKYATIADLNTAWGSDYTTFGSSATQISGEAVATTDGTSYAFAHTIQQAGTLTPDSIRIYQDGVMVAGDCFHPKWNDVCNPSGGTDSGALWGGKGVGGYVTYSKGQIIISYTGNWYAPGNTVCTANTSCTAYFVDYQDPGIQTGDHVVVQGFPASVAPVSDVAVTRATGSWTFQGTNCNPNPESDAIEITYPWTGAAVSNGGVCNGDGSKMAKLTVPAAGHVLTVDYQVNGWDAGGTGLMDEDGRPSHTWLGTDIYALSNANPNTAADIREGMYQLDRAYFTAMRNGVRAAFTDNGIPPPLYLGPDSLGTWTSTPSKETLQAASGLVDVAIILGINGSYTLTQPMLNFVEQWYGGPILGVSFLSAVGDSPYSADAAPVWDVSPSTQAYRGSTYYSDINSMLTATTTSGVNPWVGNGWWTYGDSSGTNFGLVTLLDNAYDGHEDVTGSVLCSAPLQAYTCGGEAANYGDVITLVKSANALWLNAH